MKNFIDLITKFMGAVICLWGMTLLTLQTLGSAPAVNTTGVSPWVFCSVLGIGAALLGVKMVANLFPGQGISQPDVQVMPTMVATDKTPDPMGGAVDDQKRNMRDLFVPSIGMYWFWLKMLVGALILGLIGFYIMGLNQELKIERQKVGVLTSQEMPKGVQYRVTTSNGKVRIVDQKGNIKVVKQSRGRDTVVDIDEKGNVISKKSEWMPYGVILPHAAIIATPKTISPGIGVQVLRSDALQAGVNIDMSLDSVGVSLTKDVLDNSMVGAFYGYDKTLNGTWGVKMGIYF
jgi:hypothetical protein